MPNAKGFEDQLAYQLHMASFIRSAAVPWMRVFTALSSASSSALRRAHRTERRACEDRERPLEACCCAWPCCQPRCQRGSRPPRGPGPGRCGATSATHLHMANTEAASADRWPSAAKPPRAERPKLPAAAAHPWRRRATPRSGLPLTACRQRSGPWWDAGGPPGWPPRLLRALPSWCAQSRQPRRGSVP